MPVANTAESLYEATYGKVTPHVSVWIQGNTSAGDIRAMLLGYKGIKFSPAKTIEGADMVLYTGGADVNPRLYGEDRIPGTSCSEAQDQDDLACWSVARRGNKLQVGICRGSQFLNVMNGGKLYQDVDNHCRTHYVRDLATGKRFLASSTHHQQSILTSNAVLLADANESTKKFTSKGGWHIDSKVPTVDVEAYWYPDSRSLGCQFHPEYGPKSCEDMFFEYVEKYRRA